MISITRITLYFNIFHNLHIFVGMISMTRVTLKYLLVFDIIRKGDNYDCNGTIYTEVFYFNDINGVGLSAF